MKHYEPFKATGLSFEERVGEPEAFEAAIGGVATGFSYLADKIDQSIARMLGVDEDVSAIITAELSFRQKVHILASLVRQLSGRIKFNIGEAPLDEILRELVQRCFPSRIASESSHAFVLERRRENREDREGEDRPAHPKRANGSR